MIESGCGGGCTIIFCLMSSPFRFLTHILTKWQQWAEDREGVEEPEGVEGEEMGRGEILGTPGRSVVAACLALKI